MIVSTISQNCLLLYNTRKHEISVKQLSDKISHCYPQQTWQAQAPAPLVDPLLTICTVVTESPYWVTVTGYHQGLPSQVPPFLRTRSCSCSLRENRYIEWIMLNYLIIWCKGFIYYHGHSISSDFTSKWIKQWRSVRIRPKGRQNLGFFFSFLFILRKRELPGQKGRTFTSVYRKDIHQQHENNSPIHTEERENFPT